MKILYQPRSYYGNHLDHVFAFTVRNFMEIPDVENYIFKLKNSVTYFIKIGKPNDY